MAELPEGRTRGPSGSFRIDYLVTAISHRRAKTTSGAIRSTMPLLHPHFRADGHLGELSGVALSNGDFQVTMASDERQRFAKLC